VETIRTKGINRVTHQTIGQILRRVGLTLQDFGFSRTPRPQSKVPPV
jgi:hypothetical protein